MSYNIIINSENNLNASSYPNRASLKYFIDWKAIFINEDPNQKYKLTWCFTSSRQMLQGNYTYLIYMSGLSSNQYITGSSGSTSTTSIGAVKYGSELVTTGLSYLSTGLRDNPPIFLNSLPTQNEFTIEIRTTVNNSLFTDDSVAGAGTATLAGTTLTIASVTTGTLLIGTIVTISGTNYRILNYGTGNGGTGTYTVDTTGTIGTATAYTTTARNQLGPYSLLLNFEKVSE